jgi:excisionase family DNA binding protein
MKRQSHNLAISRELFSITELSLYCGISERTLWKHLKTRSNPIPHFRIGNLIKIRKSDFDHWLETQRQGRSEADNIVDSLLS